MTAIALVAHDAQKDDLVDWVGRHIDVLSAAPADYDGHEIALSACFGVAMLQTGMTESDILAAADRDMYRSKQGLAGLPGHR